MLVSASLSGAVAFAGEATGVRANPATGSGASLSRRHVGRGARFRHLVDLRDDHGIGVDDLVIVRLVIVPIRLVIVRLVIVRLVIVRPIRHHATVARIGGVGAFLFSLAGDLVLLHLVVGGGLGETPGAYDGSVDLLRLSIVVHWSLFSPPTW